MTENNKINRNKATIYMAIFYYSQDDSADINNNNNDTDDIIDAFLIMNYNDIINNKDDWNIYNILFLFLFLNFRLPAWHSNIFEI